MAILVVAPTRIILAHLVAGVVPMRTAVIYELSCLEAGIAFVNRVASTLSVGSAGNAIAQRAAGSVDKTTHRRSPLAPCPRTSGSPKFLGEPRCEHAPLSDPGPVPCNRVQSVVLHLTAAFRLVRGRRLPDHVTFFEAPSRSLLTRCVRFTFRSPFPAQHSLPAGHHPLLGRT